ncbi:MAG: GDSL-type esterase/lipase family protein [Mariniphaga sp.]
MINSRRDFLKAAAVTSAGALLIPVVTSGAVKKKSQPRKHPVILKDNAIILFQGDSITDAGRDRKNSESNNTDAMGHGYALFTSGHLLEKYAEKKLTIYNRGVSGNKVFQLRERWDEDCIALKPDVLSILIGVNDYWHTLDGGYKGTLQKFMTDYRELLNYTKQKLPNVQLIICEPYTLKEGGAIKPEQWYPMFDEYRKATKTLAEEFHATYVPIQAIYDKAINRAPDRYWAPDGIHPGLPGAKLITNGWLKATGLHKKGKKKKEDDSNS